MIQEPGRAVNGLDEDLAELPNRQGPGGKEPRTMVGSNSFRHWQIASHHSGLSLMGYDDADCWSWRVSLLFMVSSSALLWSALTVMILALV